MAWAYLPSIFPLSVTTCLSAGRSFSFCHPELVEGTKRKRISTAIGAKKVYV
jgi:hypothetical protein